MKYLFITLIIIITFLSSCDIRKPYTYGNHFKEKIEVKPLDLTLTPTDK